MNCACASSSQLGTTPHLSRKFGHNNNNNNPLWLLGFKVNFSIFSSLFVFCNILIGSVRSMIRRVCFHLFVWTSVGYYIHYISVMASVTLLFPTYMYCVRYYDVILEYSSWPEWYEKETAWNIYIVSILYVHYYSTNKLLIDPRDTLVGNASILQK